MNGLLNLAYPLFDSLDRLIGFLPDAARLALWGALSAVATMALYNRLSGQERIKALQAEARRLRERMLRTDDAGEAARLAGENLKLAMRTLGKVTGPAMLSGLPVILVLMLRLANNRQVMQGWCNTRLSNVLTIVLTVLVSLATLAWIFQASSRCAHWRTASQSGNGSSGGGPSELWSSEQV